MRGFNYLTKEPLSYTYLMKINEPKGTTYAAMYFGIPECLTTYVTSFGTEGLQGGLYFLVNTMTYFFLSKSVSSYTVTKNHFLNFFEIF